MNKTLRLFIIILFSLITATVYAQTPKVALLLNINSASEKNAEVIVLQIDTPGGLDKAMRGINKAILSSKVPVVAFVAPSGARAATPVQIGSPGLLPKTPTKTPVKSGEKVRVVKVDGLRLTIESVENK